MPALRQQGAVLSDVITSFTNYHPAGGCWASPAVAAKGPVLMGQATRHLVESCTRQLLQDSPGVEVVYGAAVSDLLLQQRGSEGEGLKVTGEPLTAVGGWTPVHACTCSRIQRTGTQLGLFGNWSCPSETAAVHAPWLHTCCNPPCMHSAFPATTCPSLMPLPCVISPCCQACSCPMAARWLQTWWWTAQGGRASCPSGLQQRGWLGHAQQRSTPTWATHHGGWRAVVAGPQNSPAGWQLARNRLLD